MKLRDLSMRDKDIVAFEARLRKMPLENAEVLAVRAALRSVPALTFLLNRRGRFKLRGATRLILITFRALHLAWLESVSPRSVGESWIHSVAESTESAGGTLTETGRLAIFSAAYAAFAAAKNDIPYCAAVALDSASKANRSAAMSTVFPRGRDKSADAIAKRTADAASFDEEALNGGLRPRQLASYPIWSLKELAWTRRAWEMLKGPLIDADEDWEVWIDWYEARLSGKEFDQPLELARASLSNELWQAGPEVVNARIRTLVAAGPASIYQSTFESDDDDRTSVASTPSARETVETSVEESLVLPMHAGDENGKPPPIERIPPQELWAIQFDRTDEGPIDLSPISDDREHLHTDAGRNEDYAEIRVKALELQSFGTNRLGYLAKPIDRFLQLPEELNSVRAKSFWSRLTSLRIKLLAHEEATSSVASNAEPDDRLLDSFVALALKDLVETANIFVIGDPLLMELDAARSGPQELVAAIEETDALDSPLREILDSSEIATASAREALQEQIELARPIDKSLPARQGAEFARRSIRNFVAELLRRAYQHALLLKPLLGEGAKGIKEGYFRGLGQMGAVATVGAIGAATALTYQNIGPFIVFVARHAQSLVAYVSKAFQNAALTDIINWIVRLVT